MLEPGITPEAEILSTHYTMAPERLGVDFEVDITGFTLQGDGGTTILQLTDSLGTREIVCANTDTANRDSTTSGSTASRWTTGAVMPMGGKPTPVAAAAIWLSDRDWCLRLQYLETPYALILTFNFSADTASLADPGGRTVTIEATQNVAFGETALGTLHGSQDGSNNGAQQ